MVLLNDPVMRRHTIQRTAWKISQHTFCNGKRIKTTPLIGRSNIYHISLHKAIIKRQVVSEQHGIA